MIVGFASLRLSDAIIRMVDMACTMGYGKACIWVNIPFRYRSPQAPEPQKGVAGIISGIWVTFPAYPGELLLYISVIKVLKIRGLEFLHVFFGSDVIHDSENFGPSFFQLFNREGARKLR
jgi:hypothetical protein